MDQSTDAHFFPTRMAMTIGAVTAILMLLVSVTGWQILGWIAFAGGIYYGMKCYRRETGGIVTYFKALMPGVQTAFFASLIIAFVRYVTATMNPSIIEDMFMMMEQKLITFDIPSELAEMTIQQVREFMSPTVIAVCTVIGYSAIGGFLSIVFAFFVQNAKPGEFVEF